MDELPPIRNMSLTQQRIREALKNAPPLTITKKSNDFVVFDDQKKNNEFSLFDRFLRHKTIGSNNCTENDLKQNGNKWSQLKDKMIEELEIKRQKSQKLKDINEKLENEEINEIKDELTTNLFENIKDNNEDNGSDSDSPLNNDSEEEEGGEEVEEEEEEIEDDVEDEELDNSEDENSGESERESNPFINDEAEDDEEVIDEIEDKLEIQSDDSRESFEVNNNQNNESFVREECFENNGLNDNVLDTSYSVLDESFDRKCATQKIALSPFITQKPKPRFDSNLDIPELNLNNEEYNHQSLLDLCSGDFPNNDQRIDAQIVNEPEDNRTNNSDDDNHNSDSEDDKQVLNRSKKVVKVFNIESDNESETEDKKTYLKSSEDIKISLKNFNESDGEELVITEEEEEQEGEEEAEDEEEEECDVNTFFEDEAELSGNDEMSSDEDEAEEEEDLVEEEGEQEELPSDSEIEEQNKKYFNKLILDEEKRNIMVLKEKYFEDGDLHDGGRQRQKKFRWNFEANENFVNDYINDDSDDNFIESDGEDTIKMPTLKMTKSDTNIETKINGSLEKLKNNFKQSFDLKNINKNMGSETKSSSISAFIVRDKRLNTIMSFENKRSLKSKNSFKSNKRFKSSKKTSKPSIFDLLNEPIY